MDDIFDLSSAVTADFTTNEPNAPIFDNISALAASYPWIDILNPEQKEAVKTTSGPVLVLSGAGTGKTKVLTTRLAYILASHLANPWECLVVTFTNRAAQEMQQRVFNLIGPVAESVWLGTFHRICVKILRRHADLVGLSSNFNILGDDDQKRLLKQIIEDLKFDIKKYPPQEVIEKISRWKDKGITTDKITAEYKETNLTAIYIEYQKRLLALNCVDFGDIILYCLQLLMEHNDILQIYQNRFKYIMVDEYQDTNVTQYLLIRLLSQKHRNLCCVGDDDQSIYSWRGAEIENILRFNKDFADAKIIRLERNYRSTANILAAASCLIKHNSGRLGKELKVAENSPAQQADNSKIKVVATYNGEQEATYVASEISSLHRRNFDYSQMAILVRTAAQTREFEEKFISEAIPYQVIGGLKFYERAEIRDALAYFRVVLSSHDDLALERIINKPVRGIGAKTLEKIKDTARINQSSLFDAVNFMLSQNELSGKARSNLSKLMTDFAQWQRALPALSPDDLASQVLEESGYLEMLKTDKSVEAPGRIENLHELINVMSDHEKYPSMSEFMEHVSLVMDNDDMAVDNKVKLITLHSAKGLEFDVVFLPGWEESLFPHQRCLDEAGTEGLEEERRLAYVAITRAKQKLYISLARNRRIYGEYQSNPPSRFINELPPTNIELINADNDFYGTQSYSSSGYYNRNKPQDNYSASYQRQSYKSSYNSSDNHYSASGYQSSSAKSGIIGTKVHHDTFGYGQVVAMSGTAVTVCFEDGQIKKIMPSFLTKI